MGLESGLTTHPWVGGHPPRTSLSPLDPGQALIPDGPATPGSPPRPAARPAPRFVEQPLDLKRFNAALAAYLDLAQPQGWRLPLLGPGLPPLDLRDRLRQVPPWAWVHILMQF